jgi:Ca2+-binding EF-hand superfamily protein
VEEPLPGALRSKAMRVFAMAEKGADGLLDAKKLAADCDGSDMFFVAMQQGTLGKDVGGRLSMSEWLKSVKNLALEDEIKAGVFLDLCQWRIDQQNLYWPLRNKALQVFRMGDRSGDGKLDMSELTEIRQSAEFARTLMDDIDINKDGYISKGEWLAYIKGLADKNEESAAAVLELYRKHLSNSSNTVKAYGAAKSALDALVEDSSVTSTRPWWACY